MAISTERDEMSRGAQAQLYQFLTRISANPDETDEVRELATYILDVYYN